MNPPAPVSSQAVVLWSFVKRRGVYRMPVKGVRRRVRPARQVSDTPALPRRGLSVKDVDDGRCDGL